MFSWSCLIYQRYSVGFISGGGAIQFVILLLVGIKQYVLTDVFAASLLLLELSCLRKHCTAIPFENASLCFYKKITSPYCSNFFSILFCTIYEKEHIFKKKIRRGGSPLFPLPPTSYWFSYSKQTRFYWCDLNFPTILRRGYLLWSADKVNFRLGG